MASISSTTQGSDRGPEAKAQFAASLQIMGSMTIGGILYGFMTTTAGLCAHSLIKTRQSRSRRHLAFLLAYIGALWTAGTVLIGSISGVSVDMFVFHSSSCLQGSCVQSSTTGWFSVVADATAWVIFMLSDGMMLWRFKVVWSTSRYYRYLAVAPAVLYTGVITCGFFPFIIFSSHPVWGGDSANQSLITVFILSSLCLNIYITALIAGRLFVYRRRFRASWGSPDTKHYTSMGSMLIESYLPLTFCIIISTFLTYLLNNPAQYTMTSVLGQMQIIAPLIVMLRISRGIAWGPPMSPHSVEGAVDRALEAHELRMVQTVVRTYVVEEA